MITCKRTIIKGAFTAFLCFVIVTVCIFPQNTDRDELTQCSICRNRAQSLRNAAENCRKKIASGTACNIEIGFGLRKGIEVSVEEAENLAHIFEQRINDFEPLETKLQEIKKKIKLDQQRIRNLGIEKSTEAIEDWGKFVADSNNEFTNLLLNELIDVVLLGLQNGTKTVGSLGTGQGNRLIGDLKKNGINVPQLNEAIHKISLVKGKPKKAKMVNDLIVAIKTAKNTCQFSNDGILKLKTLSTVLGWFIKSPVLKVFVSEVKITTAKIYDSTVRYVSLKQINDIDKLIDQQKKILKSITDLMRQHVNELNEINSNIRSLPKCE
jgi:hypothetical protein